MSKAVTLALAGREVREFLTPARVVRGGNVVGPLLALPRTSLLQISAVRAGPGGSLVVRVFNPRGAEETATLRFARPIRDARAVDLREGDTDLGNTGLDVIRTAAPPVVNGDALDVRLLAFEIGTYLITLT